MALKIIFDETDSFSRTVNGKEKVGYDRYIISQINPRKFHLDYAESFESEDALVDLFENGESFGFDIEFCPDSIKISDSNIPSSIYEIVKEGVIGIFEGMNEEMHLYKGQFPTNIVKS